jgi:HAD superfamily hydrolase (TIGR01490 family)
VPTSDTSRQGTATLPVVPGRVAIFDLDRTIVPGSSLTELARVLADHGLLRRATIARHLVTREVFARRGVGDSSAERIRRGALEAVAGCDHALLVELARLAGQTVAERAYPGARWLLQHHLDAGDFCVILSAAPQELVETVAAALGAHRAVGSRGTVVAGRMTGGLDGPFCYGQGKLTRLAAEVGPVDMTSACAYADSASDLPLLRACGHPVAVNPDRRLLRAAVEATWPVLRFT